MTIDSAKVRIEGIYPQRQDGYFMQRVKLPAGVISAIQARCVADVAEHYGRGCLHLTSRGSMEVHWLKSEDLPPVKQEFAGVGLTSRGACGGAVRGVTCSSQDSDEFASLESLARRLQRHFTGNPNFEGLPKKFKIGLVADSIGGRHLIQDVGLVLAGFDAGMAIYDVWIAGGLGREPRPGFLLAEALREESLIPLIEAIISVYSRLAPPPKRLKFLAGELGEGELRRLIEAEPSCSTESPTAERFPFRPASSGKTARLVASVLAGQLTSDHLRAVANFADRNAGGVIQITVDQDIAFVLAADADIDRAAGELDTLMNSFPAAAASVTFRICPGSHECRMGLAATRDIAGALIAAMAPSAREIVWALSGCPNSCTQPQLADAGIVIARLVAGEGGVRSPRFDLYRRSGTAFGEKLREGLNFEELIELVTSM